MEESARNMTPIRKLLNRIHWDRTFGQADFLIGYLDRIENRIILAGLHQWQRPEAGKTEHKEKDADRPAAIQCRKTHQAPPFLRSAHRISSAKPLSARSG